MAKRLIQINVSQKDFNKLRKLAENYDISSSELIEAFIKDLVCSEESNGSDERELANAWYDRNKYNF